jgi:hypothetical protein
MMKIGLNVDGWMIRKMSPRRVGGAEAATKEAGTTELAYPSRDREIKGASAGFVIWRKVQTSQGQEESYLEESN